MTQRFRTVLSIIIIGASLTVSAYGSTPDSDASQTSLPSVTAPVGVTHDPASEEIYLQGYEAYQEQDFDKAVTLFKEAADMGNGRAQFYLGYCYFSESGVPRDYEESARLFSLSAEQGYAAAQYNLGNLYYNGLGVEEDREKAVELFRKAAEQGYADAQNNLGYCYDHGTGVAPDKATAIKWYKAAAAQGHRLAPGNLDALLHR